MREGNVEVRESEQVYVDEVIDEMNDNGQERRAGRQKTTRRRRVRSILFDVLPRYKTVGPSPSPVATISVYYTTTAGKWSMLNYDKKAMMLRTI